MSRTSPHNIPAQHPSESAELSRRGLLRTAGGLTAALALGGSTAALAGTTAAAAPAAFTHPGMLHNAGDINRAKVRVAAGTDPWLSGWKKLTANSHSQSTWTAQPAGHHHPRRHGRELRHPLQRHRGRLPERPALGRRRYGRQRRHRGQDPQRLVVHADHPSPATPTGSSPPASTAGSSANAAELMRGHAGFDLAAFQKMMVRVFYPLNNSFLTNHNGACITNYWANWDLCNMASIMAIGILNDDARQVRPGRHLLQVRRRQRLHRARGAVPLHRLRRLRPRPVAGVRPRPGAHRHGHGPDGRDLRDGLEPGRRPVLVRQPPLHEGRPVRRQVQPRPATCPTPPTPGAPGRTAPSRPRR